MSYKQLYLFVEGPDDERFMKGILASIFSEKYAFIKYISYAQSMGMVEGLVKTFNAKQNADYLFFADMDSQGDKKSSIEARMAKIKQKYPYLREEKIVIVREEIESWYAAGISDDKIIEWELPRFTNTEDLDKGKFEKMLPKRFKDRLDFMVEILKHFSFQNAVTKNKSFHDFSSKHLG